MVSSSSGDQYPEYLAGENELWRRALSEVGIMRGVTPPRITLSYVLTEAAAKKHQGHQLPDESISAAMQRSLRLRESVVGGLGSGVLLVVRGQNIRATAFAGGTMRSSIAALGSGNGKTSGLCILKQSIVCRGNCTGFERATNPILICLGHRNRKKGIM
jgi:hypothetical protein